MTSAADPYASFASSAPQPQAATAASPTQADPYASFASDKAPPSTAADVAESGASGLVRGAVAAPFAVGALPKMAADAIVNGADWAGRKLLGMPPATQDQKDSIDHRPFGVPSPSQESSDIQGALNPYLHTPQTTAGKYAETIGEFAPGAAIGPGGVLRKVTADVVAPAVASEAAGEATQGTAAEPYARFAGALTGNVGSAGARAYQTAVPRMVSRATEGLPPTAFTSGQDLANTGTRIGVPLTGPESLDQVTNNGTGLGRLQRVVEATEGGAAPMAQFYAARPDQMRTAAGNTFDNIAPASATPSMLGPRAAELADQSIDSVRQGINDATRPFYDAAGRHELDPADFAPIDRNPAFAASLQRLRNDPVLGPTYAGMPDNSVAVIDAVTKDMGARSTSLNNAANPGFQPQTASIYASGASDARDIARTPARGGTQAYDDALTIQAQARQQNLEPLERGPLGQVRDATTTQGAYGALMPDKPLSGGQNEIGDAVGRLAQRDPDLASALVRQGLADRADAVMGRTAAGDNPNGGALFAKNVAGTDQKRANLAAALGALPNSVPAQQSLNDLLDVYQATGKRRSPGSNTSGDTEIRRDMGAIPVGAAAIRAPLEVGKSLFGSLHDAATRRYLGQRTGSLADLFIDPNSVDRIAAMRAGYNEQPYFAAAGRTALTLGDLYGGR